MRKTPVFQTRAALLSSHTFGHFCVDFAAIFLLAGRCLPQAKGPEEVLLAIVAYNLTAFLLQPLAGALADAFPRLRMAALGYAAVLAALCGSPFPWPSVLLGALGNAMFHAGAGRDVLLDSAGELKWGGVFVASGAPAVPLAALAGANGLSVFVPGILVLLALGGFFLCRKRLPGLPRRAAFQAASGLPFGAVLLLALLSVAVRAFVGSAVPMSWKTGWLVLVPGVCACLGKALGGFLADRFGPRQVGVAALLLSLPLLCWGNGNVWLCAAGILLFNATMPISLGAVASKLPESPGLAFGLTAQLLAVGSLPLYLWTLPQGFVSPLCAGLILLSALCLALSSNSSPTRKEFSSWTCF